MALKITTIGEVLAIDGNGIVNFAANPGGAPANVAVAASRLGAQTAFIVKAARAAGSIITYDPNYRSSLWESEGELDDRTKDRQVAHHFPW